MSHYARIEKSERLQRVLAVLKTSKTPQTTLDLIHKAKACAINSCASELRKNGYDIKCKRRGDKWFYQLES